MSNCPPEPVVPVRTGTTGGRGRHGQGAVVAVQRGDFGSGVADFLGGAERGYGQRESRFVPFLVHFGQHAEGFRLIAPVADVPVHCQRLVQQSLRVREFGVAGLANRGPAAFQVRRAEIGQGRGLTGPPPVLRPSRSSATRRQVTPLPASTSAIGYGCRELQVALAR
jgi:hypothetical protein